MLFSVEKRFAFGLLNPFFQQISAFSGYLVEGKTTKFHKHPFFVVIDLFQRTIVVYILVCFFFFICLSDDQMATGISYFFLLY